MKTFDPDRAVEVDETADDSELETFLESIDKKAKSFRSQIIGDAFRELAQSAKAERGKLLDAAAGKFSSEAAKERNAAIDALNKRVLAAQNKFDSRVEKLLEAQDKLAALVAEIDSRGKGDAGAVKAIESALADSTQALRSELATMERQRRQDHAAITAALDALETPEEKPDDSPAKWKFTFARDHLGRIDGEVVATRVT
jgi:hypothetical protein